MSFPQSEEPNNDVHLESGSSTKLRNATVSFVTSVCLSVCLPVHMKHLGCHWTEFDEI